jgi:2-dehydropantoate 2-reductase
VADLISPVLPPSNTHTTLVLLQNGLNIEKPFLSSHPHTPVLSGVSLIGSAELTPGQIVQDDPDRLFIGAFENPSIPPSDLEARAKEFVNLYSAAGKTQCVYSPNVLHDRWKKLVYNACLNPICAITGVDTGRIRLADGAVEGLVKPAMREIVQAAKASAGVELADDVVQGTVDMDPLETYLKPSMMQDLEKVCAVIYYLLSKENGLDANLVRRAISSSLKICLVSRCARGRGRVCRCRRLRCCISLPKRFSGGIGRGGGWWRCRRWRSAVQVV